MIAARRMGIGAIGVRSYHGCRDCEAGDAPDWLEKNMHETVDIIPASQDALPVQEVYA